MRIKIRKAIPVVLIVVALLAATAFAACGGKGPASIVSITLDASAAKTQYTVGDVVNTNGVKVTALYDDGSTQSVALSDCEIERPDMTSAGEKEVTITYREKSSSYKIQVAARDTGYQPADDETEYCFEAENGKIHSESGAATVMLGNGASGTGFVGGLNGTIGATITTKVIAEEDTTAFLVVRVAARAENVSLLDNMLGVRIGGMLYDDGGERIVVPGCGSKFNWYNWTDVSVGEVSLEEGENVFEFFVPTFDNTSGNFDCFYLYSKVALTEGEKDKDAVVFEAKNAALAEGANGKPVVSGEKVTGLVSNKGAAVTFGIDASANDTVELIAIISRRNFDCVFEDDLFEVRVGENKLDLSEITVKGGETDLSEDTEVSLGTAAFVGGRNTVTFTVPEKETGGTDLIALKIMTLVKLSPPPAEIEMEGETYRFEAEQAELGANGYGNKPVIEGDHIGNVNGNCGATITFRVVSDKEGQAKLSVCVCKRAVPKDFTKDTYTVTVNGKPVAIEGVSIPAGSVDWAEYIELDLAVIDLVEGENTIVFTVAGQIYADGNSNMDYIKLVSMSRITWAGQPSDVKSEQE